MKKLTMLLSPANDCIITATWNKVELMQTYTASQCQANASSRAVTLEDSRDGKSYRIRYINGICTMIDNLNFTLTSGMTLSPDTTNVTSSRTLSTVGSLTAGDSYDEPRTAKNSNIADAGLHYNYAAATAGTIMGASNTTEATEDICPAGWRLPTGNSTGEQFILNNSYSFGSYNANYPAEFLPVAAGCYYNGSLDYSGFGGYWWSSTVNGSGGRYYLYYKTTSNGLVSGFTTGRYRGNSVRCVLK